MEVVYDVPFIHHISPAREITDPLCGVKRQYDRPFLGLLCVSLALQDQSYMVRFHWSARDRDSQLAARK